MRYAASSGPTGRFSAGTWVVPVESRAGAPVRSDRKSTRLNSSHANISYAVFCLKKKEHTSELQSRQYIVCRLLLEKKDHNRCIIVSRTTFTNPTRLYVTSTVLDTTKINARHAM